MRRKKANILDLIKLGVDYFKFERVKNSEGKRGTRYTLEKPLNDSQLEHLSKFKNVILSTCNYRYAPEVKHQVLIILDKCLSFEGGKEQ